ncbi:hypothetical protein PG999_014587 [Apiospora kogelbergensis]|uniref:Nephrocystin 3-like N-terminal domain-containing protein n=1 Tax=Apiospora kogelbergensis TaxID=1337665 RepID=A0AAW0Q702_9PEZI
MEPGTGTRKHLPIPATGLHTVVEPVEPSLDIVFVHGFTGHPERTWAKAKGDMEHVDGEASTSPAERPPKVRKFNPFSGPTANGGHGYRSVFWPRDLLPTTAPDARVMTYGYDTHIRHWIGPEGSHNTVYDIAWDFLVSLEASRRPAPARPIMLIAHSLGGIVVKEMLRRSSMCRLGQKHLLSVFDSTIGVIFFGTPHGGADPRRFLQSVAEQVIKAVGFTVNQQIVDSLLPSSERLRELRDEFAPMARQQGWAVHSFQEQMGIKPLGGRKVVDDTSSYLNAPEFEVTEHIGQNHMEMCRFVGSHDPEYRKVAAAVSRIMPSESKAATNHDLVTEPAVDHKTLQDILESLRFEQHDARHHNIKSAHTKTCKWLLKSVLYSDWVNSKNVEEHHGFFWIKGKPGTGKSTVMKFLLGNSRRTIKGTVIISFFFNARGDTLERSTVGMYRSLLLQLLEQQPSVQPVLELDQLRNRSSVGWSLELLKSLFEQAIQSLTSTPVVCFIDALDECPESEVREMVSSFSHLGRVAVSAGQQFKVCFSSRHYPHITIDKKLELVLEQDEGHGEDISNYVASELRIGETRLADEIRHTVQTKSSGIFMWVVLVVRILNKEYDSGQIHKLRRRLKEIPDDLHDLFRDILTRDARDGEELVLCLQWVLFARCPLTPTELYHAVLCGVDSEVIQGSNMEEISEYDFDRYILNCSKGLIETTRSKHRTAQFIHESVREFLLKDGSFKSLVFGSDDITHSFEALSHEKLKQCCLAQMDIAKAAGEPASLPKQEEFPFLQYATSNILHHANRAEELGKSQRGFLADFPTTDWVFLSNVCEKFKKRRYPPTPGCCERNVDGLFLSAGLLSDEDIKAHASDIFDSAVYSKQEQVIVVLLKKFYQERLADTLQAIQSPIAWRPYLFDQAAQRGFLPDDWRACPLHQAAKQGFQEVARFVLDHGNPADASVKDYFGMSVMDVAVQWEKDQIVDLFIKRGISLNGFHVHKLVKRNTAEACRLIKLSLPTSQYLQGQLCKYELPLADAVAIGNTEAVELFLNSGKAEVNARDEQGRTPLSRAAIGLNIDIIRLLLASGKVEVNARDENGWTPLTHAVRASKYGKYCQTVHKCLESIRALLATGQADIDSTDIWGKTPLFWAIMICQQKDNGTIMSEFEQTHLAVEIIRLLLEWGANPKIADKLGITAYKWWKENHNPNGIMYSDGDVIEQQEELLRLLGSSQRLLPSS